MGHSEDANAKSIDFVKDAGYHFKFAAAGKFVSRFETNASRHTDYGDEQVCLLK